MRATVPSEDFVRFARNAKHRSSVAERLGSLCGTRTGRFAWRRRWRAVHLLQFAKLGSQRVLRFQRAPPQCITVGEIDTRRLRTAAAVHRLKRAKFVRHCWHRSTTTTATASAAAIHRLQRCQFIVKLVTLVRANTSVDRFERVQFVGQFVATQRRLPNVACNSQN